MTDVARADRLDALIAKWRYVASREALSSYVVWQMCADELETLVRELVPVPPQPDKQAALRLVLPAIPQGTDWHADRYDTDDQMVLKMWRYHGDPQAIQFDCSRVGAVPPQPQPIGLKCEIGCIACGEVNAGGYEVEDGPGPFCAECWELLEKCFVVVPPAPSGAPEPPWKPMSEIAKEAASRDTIIVYDENYQPYGVPAFWDADPDDEGGQTWRAADADADRLKPTHWMRLPRGPSSSVVAAPAPSAPQPEKE